MRISDWSSDVCSSDLARILLLDIQVERAVGVEGQLVAVADRETVDRVGDEKLVGAVHRQRPEGVGGRNLVLVEMQDIACRAAERLTRAVERHHRINGFLGRSEEHTSELQSLMRISYAVFCLKKKK